MWFQQAGVTGPPGTPLRRHPQTLMLLSHSSHQLVEADGGNSIYADRDLRLGRSAFVVGETIATYFWANK